MAQYEAVLDLGQLDGSNGFRVIGSAYSLTGQSLAGAGDVNGDGFDDIILGGQYSGGAFVIYGAASGFGADLSLDDLAPAQGFGMVGPPGSYAGTSVSGAGDINGDGIDDVIVGAPGAFGYDQGGAYVVFGGHQPPGGQLDQLHGTDGFILKANGHPVLGMAVAGGGDFNGDGIDDLVVGGPFAGDNHRGSAYVVFGKQGSFRPEVDLQKLDGTDGFRIDGAVKEGFLGSQVAFAGDVNGDGRADLIISASQAPNDDGDPSGRTYVVFGQAGGLPAHFSVADLDGTNGFEMHATASDGQLRHLAGLGDVNGDGFDDIIVSNSSASTVGYNSGASYVVFGHAGGFDANIDLSALDGTDGFRLDGASFDYAGVSVSSAGDVNGDGFADIIVGCQNIGYDQGGAYVVFGKAGGFAPHFDLSSLDGTDGFIVKGPFAQSYVGWAVASAGDVNGDGLSDLMASGPGGQNAGYSYVIFGHEADSAVQLDGTIAGQTLVGGGFDDRLRGRGGGDALWGHDGADQMDGGSGDDTLTGGTGADKLAGNEGSDVFVFRSLSDSTAHDGRDLIADLDDLKDRIDLSLIDADATHAGDQAFTLVGDFTRHAGELRVRLSDGGTHTLVEADVDGDGHADLVIQLKGDHAGFTGFVL